MPFFTSIHKGCPVCLGNLHFAVTNPHPHRMGYDVHTYSCMDCGPMVNVTQSSDEIWTGHMDPDHIPLYSA